MAMGCVLKTYNSLWGDADYNRRNGYISTSGNHEIDSKLMNEAIRSDPTHYSHICPRNHAHASSQQI